MKVIILVYLIGVLAMWLLENWMLKDLTREEFEEDENIKPILQMYKIKNPRFTIPFVNSITWPISVIIRIIMYIHYKE